MINANKVVWSEGMLLRQQHFQQQERYFSHLIRQASHKSRADHYGFYQLTLAHNLLPLMRLTLNAAEGVFPEGTYFTFGDSEANAIVEPLILTQQINDQIVYLCLPLAHQERSRYQQETYQAQDISVEHTAEAPVVVEKLHLYLKTSQDDLSHWITLPVAKINACSQETGIVLDENFMFPTLKTASLLNLKQGIEEMAGLLEQRIKTLAERVAAPTKQSLGDMKEWLLLHTLNRHHLSWQHALSRLEQHPLHFYHLIIQLISELSTLINPKKYCDQSFPYQQHDLYATFTPLLSTLRQQLNQAIDQSVLVLTLEKTSEGWWQSATLSRQFFDNGQLILAVKADLPQEELHQRFVTQAKVASSDKIMMLLHSQLPGLDLEHLQTVPAALPYQSDYLYFRVNSGSLHWKDLQQHGQLAVHVTAQFPELCLSAWMMRG